MAEIRAALTNLYAKREQSIYGVNEERTEEEKRAMDGYLKGYGDYQQKRLAIMEEYNAKIEVVGTEREKLTLGER